MLLIPTYISKSTIHDLGLFASEFIAAGTEIWRFSPGFDLELSTADLEQQPAYVREFLNHYGYLDYHLNRHILCFDNARFINHSDQPNTKPDYSRDSHGVDLAIRDIAKGEEITTDYNLFERKK